MIGGKIDWILALKQSGIWRGTLHLYMWTTEQLSTLGCSQESALLANQSLRFGVLLSSDV